MENASKALIIAGAILLSILIIAVGIFVFNGANSTITDSMTSMSTQEIEAFNNQFTSYTGEQSGSNVKALIERVIANSNTYAEEVSKLPTLKFLKKSNSAKIKENAEMHSNDEVTLKSGASASTYVSNLGTIRTAIQPKHKYTVKVFFSPASGLIDRIIIYDPDL